MEPKSFGELPPPHVVVPQRPLYTPERVKKVVGKKVVTTPAKPPSPDVCPAPHIPYGKGLPHVEIPIEGIPIFLQWFVDIQAATVDGGGNLVPATWTSSEYYQVPEGYVAIIKRLEVKPYDQLYNSLFVRILHQTAGSNAIEESGYMRMAEGAEGQTLTVHDRVLPLFPVDCCHNLNLSVGRLEWIGMHVINLSLARRRLFVALWGWKMPCRCFDEYTKG